MSTDSFLTRLVTIFGEPDSANPDAYFTELEKLLAKYTDEVLDRAGDILIRTHRQRSFPKPSDIVSVCEDVLSLKTVSAPLPPQHPEWSKDRLAKADELIVSDMGRRAADEGWVLSLHDFCRKKGRKPQAHEIDKIRRDAHAFDEAFAGVCGKTDSMSIKLKTLGEAMLARRTKYAGMAYGEVFA